MVKANKTYKNYVSNAFVRSESNLVKFVEGFAAPDSTRKDLRNSITSNLNATSVDGVTKTQILYRIIENLGERDLTIISKSFNLENAMTDFLNYAGLSENYQERLSTLTSYNGHNIVVKPSKVGVRVYSFDKINYTQLIAEISTAIISGNSLTVLSPHQYARELSTFAEVLQNSDMPAGVVNILFCDVSSLLLEASKHDEVNSIALYAFGKESSIYTEVISNSSDTLKRVSTLQPRSPLEWLKSTVEFKTIWIPILQEKI